MQDTNPELLQKFTLLAKDIIYNKKRMEKFMSMLGTKQGAVLAVHAVMGAIQEKKPIPLAIAKHLGVISYVLMVDMAQEITHQKADPDIMKSVISDILGQVDQTHPTASAPAAPMPTPRAAPQGIVQQAMGVPA